MDERVSCGTFVYHGDMNNLGSRWISWLERFKLYLVARGMTDANQVKSTFLLMIGSEAYEIYKTLKKADNSDTIEEIYKFLTDHMNPKKITIYGTLCFPKRNEEKRRASR